MVEQRREEAIDRLNSDLHAVAEAFQSSHNTSEQITSPMDDLSRMTNTKRFGIAFAIGYGYFIASLFIGHYGPHFPSWLGVVAYPTQLLLGVAMFVGPIGLVLLAILPFFIIALVYWGIGLFADR